MIQVYNTVYTIYRRLNGCVLMNSTQPSRRAVFERSDGIYCILENNSSYRMPALYLAAHFHCGSISVFAPSNPSTLFSIQFTSMKQIFFVHAFNRLQFDFSHSHSDAKIVQYYSIIIITSVI